MSKPLFNFEKKSAPQKNEIAGPLGFNLVTETNSFTSVFDPRPLDLSEEKVIDQILEENSINGKLTSEEQILNSKNLKQITSEIKAIGRQGAVLMGERVFKAREILKSYRERAFTRWLENAFGNRRSGYNVLSYYEFHQKLQEKDLQESFRKIPQRIAYMLASRDADLEAKKEFIREYHGVNHAVAAQLIQEKFPLSSSDQRAERASIEFLINEIKVAIKKLSRRKSSLAESNINDISALKEMLELILSEARNQKSVDLLEVSKKDP